MLVRKIKKNRGFLKEELQLRESIISLSIVFYETEALDENFGNYRLIYVWVHPDGISIEHGITFNTIIHYDKVDELRQFFATMALLMEKQNGVILITQERSVSSETAKMVEEIVENVSKTTNTVFWYCIDDLAPQDQKAKEKYFEYLGVTEEEWLLGL